MTEFEKCFHDSPHLLLEGALGERLKREYGIRFDRHIDMGGLVTSASSRVALSEIWTGYANTAATYGLPFMATTPTRRTNKQRLMKSGFDSTLIRSNVSFLKEVRRNVSGEMFVGALVGCFGDAYTGESCLKRREALSFHSWEAELFAEEQVDFFMAGLMPAAEETLGMAQALSKTEIPYIISFTLNRNGCLPDGTRLSDAIEYIDSYADRKPLCYMTNCVHPVNVMEALSQSFNRTKAVEDRFSGIQANTSRKPFTELDGAEMLYTADPHELAQDIRELAEEYDMKIIGGCCGTNGQHIEEMAKVFSPQSNTSNESSN